MSARPKISLCIPTYNRATFLEGAVESGLREVASLPPGTVDILISDNASTDGTADLIARLQATHPELRAFRNPENLSFDRNYLRCAEEALGEFVWIMGDDDVWLPGSVSRVLRELKAGADVCLCLAEACDMDLNPLIVLPWYLEENPPRVWRLDTREDLIQYFDACARNAGAFAFISVTVFRRDRFLAHREGLQQAVGTGYIHLWGMMSLLRQPTEVHYIPEVLIRNRLSDAHEQLAGASLCGRWMHDLRGWATIADGVFPDDPGLHGAFSRILGRNHHNTILPGFRHHAPDDGAWKAAVPYLIRAGFSPVQVAAADFGFHLLQGHRLPMTTLNPDTLCLADLPLVARGAERLAVVGLKAQSLLEGATVLAALKAAGRADRVRVYGSPDCADLLEGFQLHGLDSDRYARDLAYREAIAQDFTAFAPQLVVNVDRARGIESDDLVNAFIPAGAIAFELPPKGYSESLVKSANGAYTCLIPQSAEPGEMLAALGWKGSPALWPAEAAREDAQAMLSKLGWSGTNTLVLLVDESSILSDPTFMGAFTRAAETGRTFVGLGDQQHYRALDALLEPLGDRGVNLAGVMGPPFMAALLGLSGGYLGGVAALRPLARACGCAPFDPKD